MRDKKTAAAAKYEKYFKIIHLLFIQSTIFLNKKPENEKIEENCQRNSRKLFGIDERNLLWYNRSDYGQVALWPFRAVKAAVIRRAYMKEKVKGQLRMYLQWPLFFVGPCDFNESCSWFYQFNSRFSHVSAHISVCGGCALDLYVQTKEITGRSGRIFL